MAWRFIRVPQFKFRGESTYLSGLVLLHCEDVSSRGYCATTTY